MVRRARVDVLVPHEAKDEQDFTDILHPKLSHAASRHVFGFGNHPVRPQRILGGPTRQLPSMRSMHRGRLGGWDSAVDVASDAVRNSEAEPKHGTCGSLFVRRRHRWPPELEPTCWATSDALTAPDHPIRQGGLWCCHDVLDPMAAQSVGSVICVGIMAYFRVKWAGGSGAWPQG
ncbi:hypothetical protein DCS_04275 [Drechmeria coniospora]|uniref:Uncharacterized protein n=1 Tax=Drechmeria coniospora TaxID=98403 RepID=A0A151GJK9_DRECN|nr:hypothetical protein DCS_04275 [Drechmeria coniospora]KYK57268.1 hypothetical protein DCS_04275 [Drechmeria coniospora]ODA79156.1 hypothetical protein RJ55_04748 [Drechmeria coniospora]